MPYPRGSIELDGRSLTLELVEAVARHSAPTALTDHARDAVKASSGRVKEMAHGERPVYGVNTGFGIFAQRRISPDNLSALSRNLILSHAVGVGEPFPREVTRAAMLVRANTLALGLSGVTPEVLDALLALIARDITPAIPSQGSLGSSGDLAPLAHLALCLTSPDLVPDAPPAWIGDSRAPYREAVARTGIEPVRLGPKDGLALTNGATFAAAILALACVDLQRTLSAAEAAAALSLEALLGVSVAFDERLHEARPHPGQQRVARRIRQLTRGSRLLDTGAEVQDAYSLRCTPQVLGPVWEILEFARGVVERELNSATDNPLIFGDSALSGGNFHGEPIGLASDYVKTAACEVGALSERRAFRLLSAHTSAGLPPMLVAHADQAGVQSGLMMLQYTAAALVLENQGWASPASVRSLPTSADQEDHNANATAAASELRRIQANVERIVAIELLTAAQALDLRLRADPSRAPGEGVRAVHAEIRRRVPFIESDTVLAPRITELTELIRSDGWLPPSP